ncbi:MAG: substrate-binding domain-containing protein [Candidatus Aminicenantes bacterium]|nr:substrate-binding domain-containing protein [Candidatus Aminicenantes bacterium]
MNFKVSPFAILAAFLLFSFSCSGSTDSFSSDKEIKLLVVHAGSLSIPFKGISKEFMKACPEVEVMLESYGSRTAARQVSDLKREVDVLASADSDVIRKLLYPEYADFCIDFTTNEMVLVYTSKSLFKEEINMSNWFDIILRDGVEFGHSDPDSDPCGYRSVLTMKLAEKHYGKKGLYELFRANTKKKNIRPKEVDLLAMIETGELDYLFIYRSVAEQHRLNYVVLPPEVNLVSNDLAGFYSEVSIDITGKRPGELIRKRGSPMVYGLTIPNSVKNRKWAIKFIDFIFGVKGRKIMKESGQPVLITPAADNPGSVPEELRKYLEVK